MKEFEQRRVPELIQKLMDIGDRKRRLVFGTHSGTFNADELLATAILMEELPQYQIEIIRSRNTKTLSRCDLVYDVGNGIYDHHSDVVLYPNGIRMAACGKILNDVMDDYVLKEELRRNLLYTIEAQDNGQSNTTWKTSNNKLAFVSSFVPSWDEDQSPTAMNEAFHAALEHVRAIYRRELQRARSMITARKEAQLAPRLFDGKILALERYCPWSEVATCDPNIRACIYPDLDNNYRIHMAHTEKGSYDLRYRLPEEWYGKNTTELAVLTGCFDAVFCHNTGFLMSVGSRASAYKIAKMIAELPEREPEQPEYLAGDIDMMTTYAKLRHDPNRSNYKLDNISSKDMDIDKEGNSYPRYPANVED